MPDGQGRQAYPPQTSAKPDPLCWIPSVCDAGLSGRSLRARNQNLRFHSIGGKGRCLDNIFIERLWRSLKYECVYLHAWETGSQAKAGVGRWITFYNHQRPHAAHGGQPPAVVYFNAIEADQQVQAVA